MIGSPTRESAQWRTYRVGSRSSRGALAHPPRVAWRDVKTRYVA